jgi:hypothetical protein
VEEYKGFDAEVNPGIMNVFSSAAYRYGHSTIGKEMARVDNSGQVIEEGNIDLKNAFFNPGAISGIGGVDAYLKGMASIVEQDFDCYVIDDLRNFLFGAPGSGGLDLVAININRGRDRGLPDYNTVRQYFNLEKLTSFADISSNPLLNQKLATVYQEMDQIDPWVGMLAENHMDDALFGPTAMKIIKNQFMSLRDGDRFYFEVDPVLTDSEKQEIKSTVLSDVIKRNSDRTNIQGNVFVAQELTTGIQQSKLSVQDFKIFPNPNSGSFTVKIEGINLSNHKGEIEIINSIGQTISSVLTTESDLNSGVKVEMAPNHSPGVYIVRVLADEGYLTKKFIKLK